MHRTSALFSDTIDTKIVVVSRARLKREEVLKGMNGFVLPASSYWLLFCGVQALSTPAEARSRPLKELFRVAVSTNRF